MVADLLRARLFEKLMLLIFVLATGCVDSAPKAKNKSPEVDTTAPDTLSLVGFYATGTATTLASVDSDKSPDVVLSGVEQGATVELFMSSFSCSGAGISQVASSAGTISFASFTLTENKMYFFSARQVDATGNIGSCVSLRSYELIAGDPGVLSLVSFYKSGTTASLGSVGNDNGPDITLSGVEDGFIVDLYTNSSDCTGTKVSQTASISGNISFTSFALSGDQTFLFSAKQSDGENIGPCSSLRTYQLDTTSPDALALVGFYKSGTVTSLGVTGSDNSPDVVLSGVEDGALIELFINSSDCSGTPVSSTASSSGEISFTSFTLASDQSYSFSARQTDAVGNVGTCTSLYTYELDTGLPSALSLVAFYKTGTTTALSSPGNDNSPDVVLSGVENGALVELFTNSSDCTGSSESITAVSSGNISFSSFTLGSDQSYSFSARQTDSIGNVSSCTALITYVLDTTAPGALSLFAFYENGTTTSLSSPGNDNSPDVVLSGVENGALVELFTNSSDCTGSSESVTAASAGNVSFSSFTLGSDQSYSFSARQTDATGNVGTCTSLNTYVLETAAPGALSLFAFYQNGTTTTLTSPGNDNSPDVVLSGVENGALVELFTNSSVCAGSKESATAASAGNITFSSFTLGSDQSYSFSARQTDVAGNVGSCTSLNSYQLDTVAPSAITLAGFFQNGTIMNLSSPGSDNSPDVSLNLVESNAFVELFTNSSNCSGYAESATAPALGGSIAFTSFTLVGDQTYTFSARQTDVAGNVSACSGELQVYVLDTTPPDVPSGLSFVDTVFNGQPEIRVSGVSASDTIKLFTDAACSAGDLVAQEVAAGATVDITVPRYASNGAITYYAASEDALGNRSACSAGLTYNNVLWNISWPKTCESAPNQAGGGFQLCARRAAPAFYDCIDVPYDSGTWDGVAVGNALPAYTMAFELNSGTYQIEITPYGLFNGQTLYGETTVKDNFVPDSAGPGT